MKKFCKVFLGLLAILLLNFAFPSQGWADVTTTYYARLKAQVSGNSSGIGTVYANTSSDGSGTYGASSTSNSQSTTTQNGGLSFYAFAKPNPGYMFEGWSASDNSRTLASTDNPYNVTVNASKTSSSSPSEKTVYAVFKEIPMATITYKAPVNGSYSYEYSGDVVTMNPGDANKQKTSKESVKLTATPTEGYAFLRWKQTTSDGVSYFGGNPAENVGFDKDATVEAEFVPDTWAFFIIRDGDGVQYADLNEANTAAHASTSKTIVVAKDGELIAGYYTISSGVTLLVPSDHAYNVSTTSCSYSTSDKTTSLYRKLTMGTGTKIVVNGALCVNVEQIAAGGGGSMAGRLRGAYGQIDMKIGSEISIESGANLYAWGYITGQGNVIAKSGAKVYEVLQFDFRGGSHCSQEMNYVLPLNQYYVQNIEAHYIVYAGAQETVYTAAYASRISADVSIKFIDSDGLFVLSSGARLERFYDGTTDRINYDLYGDATLNHLKVSVLTYSMDSKDHNLPLTNNMTVCLHSGTTTILYDTELLADARIKIDEDATLDIKKNLYVYDRDEWVGKSIAMSGDLNASTYAPGRTYKNATTTSRTGAKMEDALIIVNGTLKTSGQGYLYTTTGKANIISEANGKILLGQGVGTTTSIIQNVGTAQNDAGRQQISVTPAFLHNGSTYAGTEGEYLPTSGCVAGTTINYANGHWGWICKWVDIDGSTTLKIMASVSKTANTAFDYPTDKKQTGYSYAWEETEEANNQEVIYRAVSTINKYTITWQDENGVELDHETVNYGVVPSHADLTKAADAQYTYTWKGWNTTPVAVTGDATYKSLGFTQTKNKYTLTWNLDGGTITTAGTPAGSVEWGTSLTAPVVEKTGYTFNGWTPEVPATMPTENATYTAQWQAQQEVAYTINHYYESALGVKEQTPFRTDEGYGLVGNQVSAEDVLDLEGYDSPTPSTQIIEASGTVVKYYYRSRNLNVTDEVVIPGADLDQIVVENNGTLSASAPSTTKRLVLTATPGNNDGANADLTNISISESVCIEIDMNNSGTMNDKLFYCFSVPFAVNVADGVERLHKDNNTWSKAVLNTNYRVYTYNEYDRATNGRSDNNWASFSDSQFLPGVFYLCEFDNSNYNRYRFYAADKTNLNNKKNIAVSNTGDETNGGWNGVANNGLTDNQLSGDFKLIQTLNSVKNSFESAEASKKPLAIGNAAMVQVSKEGSVVVGETPSAVAARRMGEAASTEFINVRLYKENQNQHVDQIFIRASEDAAEQYVAGIDLSKATMGTPKVARMWVNDYDLQLVANEARMNNNQAIFSLGMSAPANGEYTIAIDDTPNDAIVYLTMNGSAIWNLNIAPAPISLSKGTENSYGLRLVRKINNVVTGFDEAVLNGNVQKVILNDHLYILRDGKVYSAHGHVIK